MPTLCPNACNRSGLGTKSGLVVQCGRFYRTSDRRFVQRYRCIRCKRYFSQSTSDRKFGQKKRQLNYKIYLLLVSGVSQRRIARLLSCHRDTVSKKLQFLGREARVANLQTRLLHSQISHWQFDDLETFEKTKLKPLSVTLAVEKRSRFILGFEVSKIPASGPLARLSVRKYGKRKDERPDGRSRLFRRLSQNLNANATIETDRNPHYQGDLNRCFPRATHITFKGRSGADTGQGELKKGGFDPLFSINHTFAMARANINRLFRKTWCTTKKMQALIDHLEIYVYYHNHVLLKRHKKVRAQSPSPLRSI